MKAQRLCIRDWFHLEAIKDEYKAKRISFLDFVIQVVDLGTIEEIDYKREEWNDVLLVYQDILQLNFPKHIPIFRTPPQEQKKEPELPWNYAGRNWYEFLHTISSNFHWDIDTVSALDIDDGMALIQEIRVNEHLSREWEWSLSENSIGYDEATKKSKYIRYPYPYFMLPELKELPKVRMNSAYLPVGTVVKT